MRKVVIASAVRTPIGSFMGSLSQVPAPKLGAVVIKEAVKRVGLRGDQVDEVRMGCVLMAGMGQAPARQAALSAGLPQETPCENACESKYFSQRNSSPTPSPGL